MSFLYKEGSFSLSFARARALSLILHLLLSLPLSLSLSLSHTHTDQGLGPRLTTTGDKIAMLRKNELWLPVKPPRFSCF
jgi:hypothetical protein